MGQAQYGAARAVPDADLDDTLLLSMFESMLVVKLTDSECKIYRAICKYYCDRDRVQYVKDSVEGMGTLGTLMDRIGALRRNPNSPDTLELKNPIIRVLFNQLNEAIAVKD
jgi:hypothetical protein